MTYRRSRGARAERPPHPTKLQLLATVVALLDEMPPEEITVEIVLSRSGISLGSLYHHYRNLDDLIDAGLVDRFARFVDMSIQWLDTALATSTNAADFADALRTLTRNTQPRDLAKSRLERAGLLHRAGSMEEFRDRLGTEQQRLTDELTRVIAAAQERSWLTTAVDARVAAVFVQAYTLGRAVDDVTPTPMDDDKWIALIDRIAERVFLPEV